VEYLGHNLSHDGVKVDVKKIKAMREWKIPNILKKLIGFLKLKGYYHKFVKNYGQIVTQLKKMLKKEEFSWTKEARKKI